MEVGFIMINRKFAIFPTYQRKKPSTCSNTSWRSNRNERQVGRTEEREKRSKTICACLLSVVFSYQLTINLNKINYKIQKSNT